MSRTTAARRMSLTTRTSLRSQRSTKVPGDRRQEQVRERRGDEGERGEDLRAGRRQDDGRQGELVDPVAEHRDELAGPQRRERPVEREPDVGVPAEPLDDLGAWSGQCDAGRRGQADAAPAEEGRPLECRDAGERRRETGAADAGAGYCPAPPPDTASSASGKIPTTLANRKNASPAARKTSPTETTFWMSGNGIGMTSPSGPRCSRKFASRFAAKTMWIDDDDVGRRQSPPARARAPRSA